MRNWAQPPARRRAGLKAQIEVQMKAQRWARGLVPLLACLLPAAGGGRPRADAAARASSKSVPQARKCGLGRSRGLPISGEPHRTKPIRALRPAPVRSLSRPDAEPAPKQSHSHPDPTPAREKPMPQPEIFRRGA